MARGLLRFALPLYLVFVALTLVLHLRPHDDSALRALFTSSENCVLPCWQGISPGVTSGEEAVDILENHDWVDYVRVRGDFAAGKPGTITWTWSGAQPAMLGVDRSGGRVLVIDNLVEYVRLTTALGFGDIWLGFDQPEQGRLARRIARRCFTRLRMMAGCCWSRASFIAQLDLRPSGIRRSQSSFARG